LTGAIARDTGVVLVGADAWRVTMRPQTLPAAT
jgi:hypothetical protein